jgi:hypothetical protein
MDDDEFKKRLEVYRKWYKAAYGWEPFEEVKCFQCKKGIPLIQVYRCYQCDMPFHKDCLINHCNESTYKR